MSNLNFNFVWVSLIEYSKNTGLSRAETLNLCINGKLEAYQTEGGHWKIKVYKADIVSREEYEKLVEEKTKLETIVNGISKLITTI